MCHCSPIDNFVHIHIFRMNFVRSKGKAQLVSLLVLTHGPLKRIIELAYLADSFFFGKAIDEPDEIIIAQSGMEISA